MMGRQLRTVLLSLEVRPAGRACKCKRNPKHAIRKGELRLVVKEPGPASGEQGYCAECGREMLAAAQEALKNHLSSLGEQSRLDATLGIFQDGVGDAGQTTSRPWECDPSGTRLPRGEGQAS